jgi:hypothetical protein
VPRLTTQVIAVAHPKAAPAQTCAICEPDRSALDFRVLLHASIWYHCRRFRPTSSPLLSWALSPPGCSLSEPCPDFRPRWTSRLDPKTKTKGPPELPSCGCLDGRKRPSQFHYRVSPTRRLVCLSRDYRPSWGFAPYDTSRPFGTKAALGSPPQVPEFAAIAGFISLSNPLQTVLRTYRSRP